MVLFWTIPVFFVSSLTTLSNLVKVLPFLEFIYRSPFLQGFLEGLLPTLALTIFMAVLPLITRSKFLSFLLLNLIHSFFFFQHSIWLIFKSIELAKCEYRASKSATERKSFAKLYGFHFWNVFLVITISGAIMDGITDFVNNPTGIVKALATTIPSVPFFSLLLFLLIFPNLKKNFF